MRISDWSSDVCSSDLGREAREHGIGEQPGFEGTERSVHANERRESVVAPRLAAAVVVVGEHRPPAAAVPVHRGQRPDHAARSEEHTSELQSLMRISYAVFCLKKKKTLHIQYTNKQKTINSQTQ